MGASGECEVLISGGGFAGLSLAIALAASDFRVTVVEPTVAETSIAPAFDGRVSSIAADVRRMLSALEVWPRIAEVQPVRQIVVSGGRLDSPPSPFFLHFDEEDAGAPLFHIVENRFLRTALLQRAAELPSLTLLAPATIRTVKAEGTKVHATCSDGSTLAVSLLVAADGRDSRLRDQFGIKVSGWAYGQWGIVTTVEHEKPHDGIAQEYFLPAGPFAILPMTGNRASLVWSEPEALARALMALEEDAFTAQLARRFTDYLGSVKPVGKRFAYPLTTQLARDYIAPRFALIGDAAHVIHPLAGQGLNLGLRDAAALAEAVVDAGRLGLDIGGAAPLDAYQRRRRIDATAMAGMTDALNRLFSNDLGPLQAVREAGLGAVNTIAPLRRFFARAAAGSGFGDAPRLLKGEAL